MKLFYLTFLSFTFCQLSLAQLTVRNDAFIFASDIEVYVEDDVNLTEANSTFYLRNEAQLLQGSGNTGNSGVGKLSVYQEGTVNQYAYNYWASPVGNVDANSTGNRAFTPNKNIYDVADLTNSNLAGYSTTGYNGTSSPLNIEDYWIWKYNPGTDYADWIFVGESGTVDAGYGFTMKGTDAGNQQYDFRGKPNEGEISVAVLTGQETLIGNPYPSALDAVAFIHDPANTGFLDSASLYFWEQDQSIASHNLTSYSGGYASFTINAAGDVRSFTPATFKTYNGDGTVNTIGSPSTSGKEVYRYIPIGQGFMVKGSANGNLLISDSHRTYYRESGANSEFFRTAQQNESATNQNGQSTTNGSDVLPSDYKRFRLNIDFNETYTRQLLQNFHHTATPNEDYGLESNMYSTLNSDAYWTQNSKKLVTQANAYDLNLAIPVVLNLNNQQLIRFRIFDVQNFDNNQPIYIHDKVNDTYVNLQSQNFEINLPTGNYTDRFEVVFVEANTLSTDEFAENNFNVIQNNNTSELVVLNPKKLDIENIKLYDVSGKIIFNKIIKNNNERLSYSTKNLSDGVYLVQTTLSNSNTTTKKVIVANKK
ncbi:T9SS type A sorting domain-containing protein [Mesoflavibacter zeaxanthinifaciens]|uniref:T9SS type A sorting domain-containing protein n=1 Tax=Mesoflavibacter zeaxanthinifaciens TaxID=393060 RepID=UPI0004859C30|nr:T9SS type A sorting domain-containing protein [Mesoflavibacter zeaxanthinifaciens]